MRIALTSDCYWPRVNGVTVAVETALRELGRLGHEVLVIVPDYPADPSPMDERILRVPSRPSRISPEDRLATTLGQKRAFEALLSFRPQVIHAHTEFALAVAARRAARALGVPFVMTSHTYFEQYIHHYIPLLRGPLGYWVSRIYTYNRFSKADLILTPGQSMVQTLRGYGLGPHVICLPTGIDQDLFPNEDRQPPDPSSPLLLYVGRMAMEKNVFFLLEVLERVHNVFPGARLRVVGDGPSRQAFEERSRRRGLADRLEVLGYLPHREVIPHYYEASVFVFPSLTETQGLVSLEALMAGTPVVAFQARGSAETLKDGEGAFLISPNTPADFVNRVVDLLRSPSLWLEASQRGKHYSRGWTASALAQRLEDLYRSLLHDTPALAP